MPIPNAKAGEKQSQFISRCYDAIKDEYPRAQAFGICYNKWKTKDTMSKIKKS